VLRGALSCFSALLLELPRWQGQSLSSVPRSRVFTLLPSIRHLRTKRSFAPRVFNGFEGFTLLPSPRQLLRKDLNRKFTGPKLRAGQSLRHWWCHLVHGNGDQADLVDRGLFRAPLARRATSATAHLWKFAVQHRTHPGAPLCHTWLMSVRSRFREAPRQCRLH